MNKPEIIENEATMFSRYLIGHAFPPRFLPMYKKLTNAEKLSREDSAALEFVQRHPHSLKYLDAGFAIIRPDTELRRRIYITFSILETYPEYEKYFLTQRRRPYYIFYISYVGILAVLKSLIGILVIKAARL